MIMAFRMWLGSSLVGLGFLIAPDCYWTAFINEVGRVKASNKRTSETGQ